MKSIQKIITYCLCLLVFVLSLAGCNNESAANIILDQATSVLNVTNGAAESSVNDQERDDYPNEAKGTVHVYALNIGQGDAFLVKVGNEYSLIDTGDVAHRPNIVAQLQQLGVKKFKNIIITHGYYVFFLFFFSISKNFEIENVYDNGIITKTTVENSYRRIIEKNHIRHHSLHKGDVVDFGSNSTFIVYAPWEDVIKDSKGKPDLNNNSIVGKFKFGKFSMLFTGDAEKIEEARLVKEQNSKLFARVLKVAHHGSDHSSPTKFIRSVLPEIGVISVGLHNSYNHPGDKTLARLQQEKVSIYRTDTMGIVHISTDGKAWQVETER